MEIKDLVSQLHQQWLIAKDLRRQRCMDSHMIEVAKKLAACDMFRGDESIAELARLFATPRGLEFCLASNFPNLATLRLFKPYNPAKYGIYIDAGIITLRNPRMAILIGKTVATVKCDTCDKHTVVTMHGATATVLASEWAVVYTETGPSTNIVRRTSDHAIFV